MQKRLKELQEAAQSAIKAATDMKTLDNVRIEFFGKSGLLTAILKDMKNLSSEERPKIGQMVNTLRETLEQTLQEKMQKLEIEDIEKQLKNERIDVTMPSKKRGVGSLHPLSLVKKQVIQTFMGMGFSIADGVEIETDYNSFEALNLPKDHPARDMQDTFYITDSILLRPHTSPAQIRAMKKCNGPIKILCPGRTYRADDDATHSPMFHQIEGLVVDRKVSLCDLKGLLDEWAKKLFNENTKTRFRPSYFPFTEPSVEVDVTCTMCGGKGCRLCKGTGWIEIVGAGIVNLRVLENCGVDTSIYSGLAFGMGIERTCMIKYGIGDIRLLFENDLKMLKQF